MKELMLVFVGGGAGSVVRFALARVVNQFHGTSFPYGTFVVNIIACFVLGLLVGLADHRQLLSSSSRLFWTVGFCGGFSTFSAFSNETLGLLQGGFTFTALLYIGASIVVCLAAVYIGLIAGQRWP